MWTCGHGSLPNIDWRYVDLWARLIATGANDVELWARLTARLEICGSVGTARCHMGSWICGHGSLPRKHTLKAWICGHGSLPHNRVDLWARLTAPSRRQRRGLVGTAHCHESTGGMWICGHGSLPQEPTIWNCGHSSLPQTVWRYADLWARLIATQGHQWPGFVGTAHCHRPQGFGFVGTVHCQSESVICFQKQNYSPMCFSHIHTYTYTHARTYTHTHKSQFRSKSPPAGEPMRPTSALGCHGSHGLGSPAAGA